jgi:hypothetical protein
LVNDASGAVAREERREASSAANRQDAVWRLLSVVERSSRERAPVRDYLGDILAELISIAIKRVAKFISGLWAAPLIM